jgi:peptidoglycan hydrolase CwlO-like protein
MKRKFINGFLMLALMVSAVGSFVSCKDYDDDMYVDLRGRITKESTLREALQAQVDALEALVKNLKSCECEMKDWLTKEQADKLYVNIDDYTKKIASIEATIKALQDAIDRIEGKLPQIDKNTQDIANLGQQVSDLNDLILSVKSIAEQALEEALKNKCKCDLTDILKRLKDLEDAVAGWNDKLKEVNAKADDALAKIQRDSALIAANKNAIDSLWAYLKTLNPGGGGGDTYTTVVYNDTTIYYVYHGDTIVNKYYAGDTIYNTTVNQYGDTIINNYYTDTAKLNDLEKRLKAIEDDYVKSGDLKAALDSALNAAADAKALADSAMQQAIKNRDSIANHEIRIGELENRIDTLVGQNQFKNAITVLNQRIDKVNQRIDSINNVLTDIKTTIINEVSGLIIQGTDCPLLGYLNIPLDLRSTMLIAYYGESDQPTYKFPSKWTYEDNPSFFVYPEEAFTERQLNIIGDFEQYEIKSGVRFTAGGYGADADAGTIYVTVNPNNVDMNGKNLELVTSNGNSENTYVNLSALEKYDGQLNFGYTRAGNNLYKTHATIKDADIMKRAIVVDSKELENTVKGKSIGSLASAAATVLRSFNNKVPACGLKYTWNDDVVGSRSVYSQYNVAPATFKPLSFNVLHKAFESEWNTGKLKNKIYDIIAKITDKIKSKLPPGVEFEDITYSISDDYKYFTYTYPDGTSDTMEINFTPDEIKVITKLIKQINESYGASSPVNDFMKAYMDVYKYLEKENYQNLVEKLYSKFMMAEHLFDVALVYKQGGSMGLAWPSVSIPSWMPKIKAGSLSFIPTSYTLELFAPAYKKFVAITDVFEYSVDAAGNRTVTRLAEADAKAEADAATGSNMKQVFSGIKEITMTGKKNYMYEVSYVAVDYRGLSTANQFYVLFE